MFELLEMIEAEQKTLGRKIGSINDLSPDLQGKLKKEVMPEVLSQGWGDTLIFLGAFGPACKAVANRIKA